MSSRASPRRVTSPSFFGESVTLTSCTFAAVFNAWRARAEACWLSSSRDFMIESITLGETGVRAYGGGAPGDPGRPVTHDAIVNGQIPAARSADGTVTYEPPGTQIWPRPAAAAGPAPQ